MGVAGSGKSVQGKLLADKIGYPWLSTGEFLRMLISGDKRKDMLAGKLLDDQDIIKLVRKVFAVVDTDQRLVLDGFPRTVAQADWLLSQVKHGQLHVTAVVHIIASKPAVKRRLLDRGRQDDNPDAIDERFKEYEESIKPILEQFKKSGITIHEIDGEKTVNEVHEQILEALNIVDDYQS